LLIFAAVPDFLYHLQHALDRREHLMVVSYARNVSKEQQLTFLGVEDQALHRDLHLLSCAGTRDHCGHVANIKQLLLRDDVVH